MVFVGNFQVESNLYSLESLWLKNNNKSSPLSHTLPHAIIRHMSNFPWALSQHILQPTLPLDVSKLPSLCMFTDAVVSVIRVHLTPAILRGLLWCTPCLLFTPRLYLQWFMELCKYESEDDFYLLYTGGEWQAYAACSFLFPLLSKSQSCRRRALKETNDTPRNKRSNANLFQIGWGSEPIMALTWYIFSVYELDIVNKIRVYEFYM